MGAGNDKPPKKPAPARDGVSRDSQGNVGWKWAMDSGRHLIASTSMLLRRLEVPGLKLEEDAGPQDKKIDLKSGKPTESPASAGYDPYGQKRVSAAARRPAPAKPAAKKPAAAPSPRRSWWQRLFRRD